MYILYIFDVNSTYILCTLYDIYLCNLLVTVLYDSEAREFTIWEMGVAFTKEENEEDTYTLDDSANAELFEMFFDRFCKLHTHTHAHPHTHTHEHTHTHMYTQPHTH